MFARLAQYASFVKLSHTVFALPFALASMLVAARDDRGWPGWRVFLLILAAMVCARTCAMAFNRIMDRKFDALNPRTANRHLPAGQIPLWSAWGLWAMSAVGLIGVSWFLNRACFILSPVALAVVCFYSLTKRFTDFTHVFLGVALGLAPVGAWLAVTGNFSLLPEPCAEQHPILYHSSLLPLLLAISVVWWLIGFDIIYALQDYDFDRAHGLRSLVVRWGPKNALRAAFLAHLFMWGGLAAFGLLAGFRIAYAGGLIVILASLVVEHWVARRRQLDWVNVAFFRLNALISFVFLAVVAGEVIFRGFVFRA
jgi:4-hydroxybenzoate polyprenyltransferase